MEWFFLALRYVYTAAPYVIAFGLAVALVVGPFALHGMTQRWTDTWRAAVILWLIAISAVLNIVLVPRKLFLNADGPTVDIGAYIEGATQAGWLSRLFTIGLIGFALAMLLSAWLSSKKTGRRDPVWTLGIVLALYYLVNILAGATVAGVPGFNHKSLYLPIVLGALISLPHVEFSRLIVHLKLILSVVMLMNLVAAAVFPDFAVLRPYAGQLPGIDFRLYGVTAQANTLGPIALLLLLLELYFPSRALFRWPILALALANFLLAQSKTAWLTAFAVVILAYLPYRFMAFQTRADGHASAIKLILVLLASLMVGLLALANVDIDRLFSSEVLSLTGRSSIWADTLAEFARHPLFGYGPSLWGWEYRFKMGKLAAGQAHNQFIQTLGESGLVGFILLLAYLGVLLRLALHSFRTSRGFSLALYVLILVRCITEAPLRGAVNDWPFFIHATLLIVLASYTRQAVADHAVSRAMQPSRVAPPPHQKAYGS
jgi:O-antigen ligase